MKLKISLAVLIIAVGVFIYNMADLHEYAQRKNELGEQKETLEQRIEQVEHEMGGAIDYDDIIRIARERYHLAFPDETVIYSGQGLES